MRVASLPQTGFFILLAAEVLLLSGCGSRQTALPGLLYSHSPGLSQDSGTATRTLWASQVQGEAFKAYKVQVVPGLCYGNDATATFTANGKATGPFPGHFTAQGGWSRWAFGHWGGWSFNQSFSITSGVNTVVGSITGGGQSNPPHITCRQFGATSGLQYTSNGGSGAASTTGIARGSFGEDLL